MKIASFFVKKISNKVIRFNLVWVFILLISLLIKGLDTKRIEVILPNLLNFFIFIVVGNGILFLEYKNKDHYLFKKNRYIFFFLNLNFLVFYLNSLAFSDSILLNFFLLSYFFICNFIFNNVIVFQKNSHEKKLDIFLVLLTIFSIFYNFSFVLATIICFFVMIITLAWRKEKEELFLKLNNLEEKKAMVGHMENASLAVQNILHEMRTPLTLIISPLEDEAHKENNKNVEVALKNSKRLYHLTNQLLEIHRATSSAYHIKLQPVNIIYFLSRCSELFAPTAEKKEIPFKLTINGEEVNLSQPPKKVLIVLADKESLEKIIFNYLSNALKFSKGKIIELAIVEENEKIKVSVKDRGDGVKDEKYSELFNIYRQLDQKNIHNGFGIGLSLVKKLMEKMNGGYGVRNRTNGGAEFWVSFEKFKPRLMDCLFLIEENDYNKIKLPLQLLDNSKYLTFNNELEFTNFLNFNTTKSIIYNPKLTNPQLFRYINQSLPDAMVIPIDGIVARPKVKTEELKKHLDGKSTKLPMIPEKSFDILIVEDDEDICDLYETIVGEITPSFIITQNIEEARDVISKYRFKGVLCDAGLPDGNGVDILAEITKTYPDTHRILVTGRDDGPLLQMAINKGQVDKAIFKPWDTSELKRDIGKAIQKNSNLNTEDYNISGWDFEEKEQYKEFSGHEKIVEDNEEYSKETILIVDNNPDIINFNSNKLNAIGYRCLSALNGKMALEKLNKYKVDLVITDWVMNEMSGLDLIKIMKEKKELFSIPTILLTSKSDKESIIEGRSIGADSYLSKPFDGRELLTTVNNLLNLKKNIEIIERQKVQLEDSKKYSEKLEVQVSERTKLLSESLAKVNAIMDKIKMSIFVVDEVGIIREPISKYSKNIFQKEIIGSNIKDILKIKDGSQTHLDLTSVFNLVFGSDEIQFLSIEDRLPEKLSIPDETVSKNKDLKINYAPILDEDEEVESILCIVEDVSDFESNFRQAKKDQFHFKIINEILNKDNKKEISKNIEICINLSLSVLDEFVSPTSDTFKKEFFIEKVEGLFTELMEVLVALEGFQENLKEKLLDVKSWNDIAGEFDFQLLSVEKVSETIETLIAYAHVSNIFFPVNFQFNFSFTKIIIEKIENINNIFKNLFVYVPGLEQLDKVKLKHVAKVARMYPEFDRTMNLINQRSKLISFLLKAMMEEELSIEYDKLANLIKEIPTQNKITESNLKHNLIAPYKSIVLNQDRLLKKLMNGK